MRFQVVDQPRRWAAFHCFGVYGQMMDIQASVEDIEGALAADQPTVAKYAGLTIVRNILGLRSLLAGGLPPESGNAVSDSFADLPENVIAEGLGVARRLARATDPAQIRAAADDLFAYVHRFEHDLGFDERLPSVRRPEGLFPALRLAREILPVNRSARLPMALPDEWISSVDKESKR